MNTVAPSGKRLMSPPILVLGVTPGRAGGPQQARPVFSPVSCFLAPVLNLERPIKVSGLGLWECTAWELGTAGLCTCEPLLKAKAPSKNYWCPWGQPSARMAAKGRSGQGDRQASTLETPMGSTLHRPVHQGCCVSTYGTRWHFGAE